MTEKKIYTISTKTISGNYNVIEKSFTREEFDTYYDNVVAKGGKVIGYTTR